MTGEEFKLIRKELKKTQATMATALGVKHRTVQNWEGNINSIPDSVVLLLQYIVNEHKPNTDVNGFVFYEKEGVKIYLEDSINFILKNSTQALKVKKFKDFIDSQIKDGVIKVLSSDN